MRISDWSSDVCSSDLLVKLDRPMSDVFIADPAIADIQVRSPSLLYIFGKGPGETSLYATDKAGAVVYSANVRVGNNFDQVRTMLRTAMPGEAIDEIGRAHV